MAVLGNARNKVTAPMKVSAYLTVYRDLLYYKRFAKIERQGGELLVQDEHEEDLHTREGAWLRSWKNF